MADPFEEFIERFKRFDVDILKKLDQYQRQDFISLNEHLSQRHIEHSDKLRRHICVYLDQKYWIYIRDARLGSPQSPSHLRLLELLETLLRDDKVICPVSSSTLHETAKIQDRRKREAMVAVVDEFSKGIAVRPMNERIRLEFFERWSNRDNATRQHRGARQFIWTWPSLALGLPLTAPPKEIPPKIAKAIGKILMDELISMPFSRAMNLLYPEGPALPDHHEDVVDSIDSGRRDADTPQMAFNDEFPRECAGFLLNGILIENGRIDEPIYHPYSQPDQSLSVSDKEVYDFLVAITRTVAVEGEANAFPSMYIWAGLHTKGKVDSSSYTMNDILDFDHACAAVPYCEAFFTERRLSTWLRQRPIAVNTHFDCEVIGDDESAIKYLESLL